MSEETRTETTYRAVLGAILANRRNELGLRQEDVAKAAGLSTATWSRIEKGENPLTTEQLRRAGAILTVSPSALIRLEEDAVKELERKGTIVREELSLDSAVINRGEYAAAGGGAIVGAMAAGMVARQVAASGLAGASFMVPVVGPVLGALIAGLSAYRLWQSSEEREGESRATEGGDVKSPTK